MSQRPLLYLITSGETTSQETSATEDFSKLLQLIKTAVAAGIDLLQIREKNLSASALYDLSKSAAAITRGSATKLLINDRADIAAAAGADGVHLTTRSLPTRVIRQTFGTDLLIGVSTHSLAEANAAVDEGAHFVVFGPVFPTATKSIYGEAQGLDKLASVCSALAPFPVLALGGLTSDKVSSCVRAGAAGVAAISMFKSDESLREIVHKSGGKPAFLTPS